jgi:hypothetical protein
MTESRDGVDYYATPIRGVTTLRRRIELMKNLLDLT